MWTSHTRLNTPCLAYQTSQYGRLLSECTSISASYDSTKDVGASAVATLGLLMKSGRQKGRLQGPRYKQSYVGWDGHRLHDVVDNGEL